MIIPVPAGASLQTLIDAAFPGDILELESGATFLGNFTEPVKADGGPITLRGHATLRTPNNLPALRTISNTARWGHEDLTFAAGASNAAVVQLGDGLIATEAALPRDFTFDRCDIVADTSAKNGLEMNAANVTLRGCGVRGVKHTGSGIESHAIIAYNSPGPFLIEGCHIEAGSCGFFIGGNKPAIPNCIASDIVFRRNMVTRPLAMHGQTGWAVKNLFELKNAQRVQAYGNTFENNWPDGQSGYAIVLTVRANSTTAPWTTVQHVLFENNIVRHVGAGFNILGLDDELIGGVLCPSVRMDDVIIRNNLIHDLDRQVWTAPNGALAGGVFMQIGGAPRNLQVLNNTVDGVVTGNIVNLSGAPMPGFRFEGNIAPRQAKGSTIPPLFPYDTYGIVGTNQGEGNGAIAAYCAPDRVITNNVLAGAVAAQYNTCPGNLFPTIAALRADYTDIAAGNFRLKPTSIFMGRGVNQDAIEAAQVATCVYTVSPTAFTFAYGGNAGQTVTVTRSATTCPVEIVGMPEWVNCYPVGEGILVDAFPNSEQTPRTATFTIAGQSVTVTQDAAPTPEPTLADRIATIAELHAVTSVGIGGDVSPQYAARQAIWALRDALIADLA